MDISLSAALAMEQPRGGRPKLHRGRGRSALLALIVSAVCTAACPFGHSSWVLPGRSSVRKGSIPRSATKTAENAEEGRIVRILSERVKDVELPNATVETMDRLMKKEAVEVLAAGAERTEPIRGKADLWHAYMKPTRMGSWTNQVRLTCKLQIKKSGGGVDVDVISFDVGQLDEDKNMVFKEYETDTFSLEWQNSLTWRQRGEGLRLIHSSSGRMRMVLPWWFPVPDALVKATAGAGVNYMIADGQSKVAAAIEERYQKMFRA
eukprot:TRINITY_DN23318_c2_g1_i1.p1 TRINITY_DN23318_c2_g1~~TRINITY_DN23318_c2_g1_i1.p1  ORF type:complete len:277 (-),score=40.62 TRINITY_DN23318_c2_g1_i1:109-900(-)